MRGNMGIYKEECSNLYLEEDDEEIFLSPDSVRKSEPSPKNISPVECRKEDFKNESQSSVIHELKKRSDKNKIRKRAWNQMSDYIVVKARKEDYTVKSSGCDAAESSDEYELSPKNHKDLDNDALKVNEVPRTSKWKISVGILLMFLILRLVLGIIYLQNELDATRESMQNQESQMNDNSFFSIFMKSTSSVDIKEDETSLLSSISKQISSMRNQINNGGNNVVHVRISTHKTTYSSGSWINRNYACQQKHQYEFGDDELESTSWISGMWTKLLESMDSNPCSTHIDNIIESSNPTLSWSDGMVESITKTAEAFSSLIDDAWTSLAAPSVDQNRHPSHDVVKYYPPRDSSSWGDELIEGFMTITEDIVTWVDDMWTRMMDSIFA
ncbi:unnamed protein product [Orchesella dallaii]|uniref:Uncharacterized protein n=1 Tax=Orchesella dallaii TaxID=48710 RepID=A0ABP1QD22_9HEXA